MPMPTLEAVTAAAAAQVGDTASAVAPAPAEAIALVERKVGALVDAVPAVILERAAVDVAAELYHRRRIRHGIVQMGDAEVTPVRVSRDPAAVADAILAPWLGPGIGA